jgi:hypothetical protein
MSEEKMARTLSPFGFDASHIGALMTVLEWVRKGAPTVRLHALALPLGLTLAYSCECMDWGVACPPRPLETAPAER